MAIYICGKCHFCIERRGEVDACPSCGHSYIRNATKEEIARFKKEIEKKHDNSKEG